MQLWLQKPLLRFRGVILLISLDIRSEHLLSVLFTVPSSLQSPTAGFSHINISFENSNRTMDSLLRAGWILGSRQSNETLRYFVTMSLIGWAQA